MDVKFFGQYLLEKHLINREQLLEAMQLQKATNLSMGAFAVKAGLLDRTTLQLVESYQVKHNLSFIAACNKLKAVPAGSLDKLLTSQMAHNILIGEALVRKNILSRESLDEHFHNFRTEQSMVEFNILQAITAHPHADLIGIAIQALTNLLRYLMQGQIRIADFQDQEAKNLHEYPWVIYQEVQGGFNFIFELYLREPLAILIGTRLARREIKGMDEWGMDASKEFTNIVVGYICSMLSLRNIQCETDVPLIQKTKDKPPFGEPLAVTLLLPEDAILMQLVMQQNI